MKNLLSAIPEIPRNPDFAFVRNFDGNGSLSILPLAFDYPSIKKRQSLDLAFSLGFRNSVTRMRREK
jgi:hypothetical protein